VLVAWSSSSRGDELVCEKCDTTQDRLEPSGAPYRCPASAADAHAWIRGTVTSVEPGGEACETRTGADARAGSATGCIIMNAIGCSRLNEPPSLSILLDGVRRDEPADPNQGLWSSCDVPIGPHRIGMCSALGQEVSCELSVVPGQTVWASWRKTTATLHVRVDHVIAGDPAWAGTNMKFTLGYVHDDVVPHVGDVIPLEWTETTPGHPTFAHLCELANAPAPGCSRCDGGSSSGPESVALAVVLLVLVRRRRQ
jgi:MYXO-CTERM domain-containing protein